MIVEQFTNPRREPHICTPRVWIACRFCHTTIVAPTIAEYHPDTGMIHNCWICDECDGRYETLVDIDARSIDVFR